MCDPHVRKTTRAEVFATFEVRGSAFFLLRATNRGKGL